MVIETFIKGIFIGGSLIIAIGAQNAFVLKQGLLNNNIFIVCLICSLCDASLIFLGVSGLAALINNNNFLSVMLALSGGLFLFVYSMKSFYDAYKANSFIKIAKNKSKLSLKSTIITTFSITLLNPHVYLDTVVVIGGVSSVLNDSLKFIFMLGAIIASFVWFFSLGYFSKFLTPLLKKSISWVVLDSVIGTIMLLISYQLFKYTYNLMYVTS